MQNLKVDTIYSKEYNPHDSKPLLDIVHEDSEVKFKAGSYHGNQSSTQKRFEEVEKKYTD